MSSFVQFWPPHPIFNLRFSQVFPCSKSGVDLRFYEVVGASMLGFAKSSPMLQ